MKGFPKGLINRLGVGLMNHAINFKSGKYIAGDSKRFKGTFVGTDELKKIFPSEGEVRGNANTLDIGIIIQFVDFGCQFDDMSFGHVA